MSIKLTWTDPNFDANNEEGFKIYRSASPMTPGAMPAPYTTLQADVTEYTFPEDVAAFYRVGAYRAGYEALSDEYFFDPGTPPITTPRLDLDFVTQTYLVDSITTPFASLFTFSGGQGGTYYDAAGVMQVAGVDELRFDHDPITLEPRGVLIESQAYNYIGPSEDLTGFTKVGVTVSPNVETTPRGTLTGDKVVEDVSAGVHEMRFTPSGSGSANDWTESAFIKPDGRTKFQIEIIAGSQQKATFDLVAKTFDDDGWTAYLEELPNGWFRCGFTGYPGGGGSSHEWRLRILDDAGNESYTGDGVSGLIVWGIMSEPHKRITSYVPSTANNTDYRRQDVLTMPLSAIAYNADEGSWLVDYQSRDDAFYGFGSARAWLLEVRDDSDVFFDNIIMMQSFGFPLYQGAVSGLITRDGLDRADEYTLGTDDAFPDLVPDGGWFPPLKGALTYKKNQVQVVGTNQPLTQDLDCLLPTGLTRATFGGSVVTNTNRHLSGYIRGVKYWSRILTPAELDAVTT